MARASFLLRARPDSAPSLRYEFHELFLAMLSRFAVEIREKRNRYYGSVDQQKHRFRRTDHSLLAEFANTFVSVRVLRDSV